MLPKCRDRIEWSYLAEKVPAHLLERKMMSQELTVGGSRGRKFGPKREDHPSVGEKCPACQKEFKPGDYTTLVSLGPGGDEEEQQKARQGGVYNAVAVEVHWSCATGEA